MAIKTLRGFPPAGAGKRFGPLRSGVDRRGLGLLLLALLCVLLSAALSALAPLVLARLVDDLASGAAGAGTLAIVYGACLGLARAAGEGRSFFHGRAEQDILRALSLGAAAHVLSLPMRFFQGRSTGALVQTIENGLQGYRLLLQHGVFTLIPGTLEIAIMAGLLLYAVDGVYLAVFALCALLYGAVFAGGAKKVLTASRDVSAARIEVTGKLADSLLNIETIKAFSGEAVSSQRLDHALLQTRQSWRRFYSVRCRNGLFVTAIFSAGLLTTLLLGVYQIRAGEMSPGDFVLVSAYMIQIVRPMELLGLAARDIGQGAAFIEQLSDILQEQAESRCDPQGAARPPGSGMAVSFASVSYTPPGSGDVLKDISIEIAPGARIGLVGASGSGKSTLLRLLLGFEAPSQGDIRIDGAPQSDFCLSSLRQQIAYIPQAPRLFHDSLGFNVGFPGTDVSEEAVADILGRVGLDGLAGRMAGEGGCLLSGGERQRAAIARALLRRPRLVLADEPTSALDPETELSVLEEMQSAFEDATWILASHRLRAVRDMDLILVMAEGKIAEAGTHHALRASGGVYARMWQMQERGRQAP